MKTHSYRSDMTVCGGISHDSSKTVLNTLKPAKINSRGASEEGIALVQPRCLQQKSNFTCEIPSESIDMILDMNKTNITGITGKRREKQITPNTKVQQVK